MLESLRHIVQEVDTARSFKSALDTLVVNVKQTLNTDVCSVFLVDRETRKYVFAATDGLNKGALGKVSLEHNEGLVGQVGLKSEPVNLEDATTHPDFHFIPEVGEEPFHAFLGVPIIHHRRLLGVLVVQQTKTRRFDENEEAFMVTLSAQLAGIIASAEATGETSHLGEVEYDHLDAEFVGIPGAPGFVIGTAVVIHPAANLDRVPDKKAEDITQELLLFDKALESVRNDIRRVSTQLAASLPKEEVALFDAYLHMLDDNALGDEIRKVIRTSQWAQGAVREVIQEHIRKFEQMKDSYLRERAADVRELGQRILAYLQELRRHKTHYPEDTILVGEEISPSMMADVPEGKLKGIVSLRGSGNSHVAILARAMDVPTVMGAVDIPLYSVENHSIIVDGYYGHVYANPSQTRIEHFRKLRLNEEGFVSEMDELKDLPAITLDGHRIRLWANVGFSGDLARSLDRGAEGIGLFRTEVPFMTSERFPTEEEQRRIYHEHIKAFSPRPVTMRTLDIGGDKKLSYFPIVEDNPFLGWRGIRVTLDHPEIFIVQARAMIKANAGLKGELRIMLPMVSRLSEVEEGKALVERAYQEIKEEGYDVIAPLVGVMIEVPAAVYQARQLAKITDFLAVGSNDLTQYMLAVDRNNPRVADLYKDLHPAVIQALREVSKAGHLEGKAVGICGELAGTAIGAILLVGMGYDVLSMNATSLPRIKWVLRHISLRRARLMLSKVLRMHDSETIIEFMQGELLKAGLERVVARHTSN